jgi:hypothetical protein
LSCCGVCCASVVEQSFQSMLTCELFHSAALQAYPAGATCSDTDGSTSQQATAFVCASPLGYNSAAANTRLDNLASPGDTPSLCCANVSTTWHVAHVTLELQKPTSPVMTELSSAIIPSAFRKCWVNQSVLAPFLSCGSVCTRICRHVPASQAAAATTSRL